ncbi:MAG: hypothetical protein KH405_04795 [Firmicutes bacterium]|nr:hypothetical protein [Bacillota bacterium]
MNNKTFVAKITWLSKEQGGRKGKIPIGLKKYAPLIAIDGNKIFNGSAWSVICFPFELIEENKTKALIRFLNAEDAPDILRQGIVFELFEGAKKVADGEIIEESSYCLEIDK